MTTKRVGFLVYPAIQALDIAGPMDAFAAAVIRNGARTSPAYQLITIGFDAHAVRAESGLLIKP
jgi:transcriptional regulator GlxA family with amidase domain